MLLMSCHVIQVINASKVTWHVSGGECCGKWVPAISLPGLLSNGCQAHTGLVTSTMLLHHLHTLCKWQPPGLPLAFHLAMGVGACAATVHACPT